jgi:hypothetical protein
VGDSAACIELREACIDFGQEDEPFDCVVECRALRKILKRLQDPLTSGWLRHDRILPPSAGSEVSSVVPSPGLRPRSQKEQRLTNSQRRAGTPIKERSHCSDGRWTFDGKTLRFAKPIPLPERRDTSMPLTLQPIRQALRASGRPADCRSGRRGGGQA